MIESASVRRNSTIAAPYQARGDRLGIWGVSTEGRLPCDERAGKQAMSTNGWFVRPAFFIGRCRSCAAQQGTAARGISASPGTTPPSGGRRSPPTGPATASSPARSASSVGRSSAFGNMNCPVGMSSGLSGASPRVWDGARERLPATCPQPRGSPFCPAQQRRSRVSCRRNSKPPGSKARSSGGHASSVTDGGLSCRGRPAIWFQSSTPA